MWKSISAIVLMVITCQVLRAQEIYTGIGMAFSEHSGSSLVTDSLSLSTTNHSGRKYVIPQIGVRWNLGRQIMIDTELALRRHTISLQFWDARADTCRLCPLKKGGGPTITELRIMGRLKHRIGKFFPELYLSGGIGMNIPLGRTGNEAILPPAYADFAEIAENINALSCSFELGFTLNIKRFAFGVYRVSTASYTRSLAVTNTVIPFQTRESMWRCMIGFVVFQ
jgi:hypothetical protein